MGKALLASIRKIEMENPTVYSTDQYSFILSFSFPLIKISKIQRKGLVVSSSNRKCNAFKKPDYQSSSLGFSRQHSADLQIKVMQPITVS